jgi:outer membrane receptor protein involved in Fe transport
MFFRLTGTYVKQDLEIFKDSSTTNRHKNKGLYPRDLKIEGLSDFFVLDTSIGFRLPGRRGLISFEGRNLLDDEFFFRNSQFYVSQPIPPRYAPFRSLFVQLTLNF